MVLIKKQIFIYIAFIIIFLFPLYASGEQTLKPDEITPPHVYASVQLILGELELIRKEMGKPESTPLNIGVSGSVSREVHFQAMTMFRKANRLSYEITRLKVPEHEHLAGKIQPADVLDMVVKSVERLRLVKEKLGIPETVDSPPIDSTKKSDDVFYSILLANQQINRLLDRQFSSNEVFQQTTLAVSYVSRILGSIKETERIAPQSPKYLRRKKPLDVYNKLSDCFILIEDIARISKIEILEEDFSKIKMESITPSDVYDFASLIVSELAYMHSLIRDVKPPHKAYYPIRKIPSDVFQRAGMLESQLKRLKNIATKNPEWLKEKL